MVGSVSVGCLIFFVGATDGGNSSDRGVRVGGDVSGSELIVVIVVAVSGYGGQDLVGDSLLIKLLQQ
jgi:hypothetical protein